MLSVAFSLEFRGHATPLSPGVLTARASAPRGSLLTRADADGMNGACRLTDGEEALLERRLTFLDETRFDELGTISFGNGNAIRFRSLGPGNLAQSADPELRQGTPSSEIDGGAGALAGATGRIVSNFVVSTPGELTAHQTGLLFIPTRSEAQRKELSSR